MRARYGGMLESYGLSGNAMTDRAQGAFMTQMVAGSPEKCVTLIELSCATPRSTD